MMGAERKSMVMSEKEKRNTAFHEAGHTIVGRLVPEHDPVYKVSIIPRGRALGVTMFLPQEDRYSHSRRALVSHISSLFGGRIAEELILGKDGITTGATNDIQRATEIARNMVVKWGLSERMGPLNYDEGHEEVFLGRAAAVGGKHTSDETAKKIDEEVRHIIDEAYTTARQLLVDNMDKLHAMAEALIQYETLDSDQIDDIMGGRPPRPPADWDADASGGAGTGDDVRSGKPAGGSIGEPAGEH
jgi:cell division protease FtsH